MVKIDKFEFVQIIQCKPVPVVYIVQCHSGGSGGFARRELCYSYKNIGKQRKARQRLASGLVSVFLFYVPAFLPALSLSAPLPGLFSASGYVYTFFLFVSCRACYAVSPGQSSPFTSYHETNTSFTSSVPKYRAGIVSVPSDMIIFRVL